MVWHGRLWNQSIESSRSDIHHTATPSCLAMGVAREEVKPVHGIQVQQARLSGREVEQYSDYDGKS